MGLEDAHSVEEIHNVLDIYLFSVISPRNFASTSFLYLTFNIPGANKIWLKIIKIVQFLLDTSSIYEFFYFWGLLKAMNLTIFEDCYTPLDYVSHCIIDLLNFYSHRTSKTTHRVRRQSFQIVFRHTVPLMVPHKMALVEVVAL